VSVVPPDDWVVSAEEEVMRGEQRHELDELLSPLSPAERVPLVMAALGYRANEIALVVGCAENAVRTRMCRLRRRLRAEGQDIG
jgi:DNA-directed RNA polymerase specialized sigma24 family protein